MIERTGANDGWATALGNGNVIQFGGVLTVDLERVWMVDTPIVFFGAIKDIKSSSTNSYEVVVEESLWSPGVYYVGTDLRLRLNVTKDVMDKFLERHPDLFGGYGLNNGAAVVARIMAIEQLERVDEAGGSVDIKIGVGSLVDIVYTHRERF